MGMVRPGSWLDGREMPRLNVTRAGPEALPFPDRSVDVALSCTVLEQGRLFGAGVLPGECADASLYQRFCAAGLTQTSFFPQVTALAHDDQRLPMFRQQALSVLDANESEEWHAAIARADAEGTSLIATPHHCAVGTKP
jgi:hypothetical protein